MASKRMPTSKATTKSSTSSTIQSASSPIAAHERTHMNKKEKQPQQKNNHTRAAVWQHPFVDVFRLTKISGSWENATKVGNARFAMDKAIGKRALHIEGAVQACNNATLPSSSVKGRSATLGLTGRFLYIQMCTLKSAKSPIFVVHVHVLAQDKTITRFSLSNMYLSPKRQGNNVQVPLLLSDKWTTVVVDLRSLLEQHQSPTHTGKYWCIKSIQLCSNMVVRGCFTSDIVFDFLGDKEINTQSSSNSATAVPKEMLLPLRGGAVWSSVYDTVFVPTCIPKADVSNSTDLLTTSEQRPLPPAASVVGKGDFARGPVSIGERRHYMPTNNKVKSLGVVPSSTSQHQLINRAVRVSRDGNESVSSRRVLRENINTNKTKSNTNNSACFNGGEEGPISPISFNTGNAVIASSSPGADKVEQRDSFGVDIENQNAVPQIETPRSKRHVTIDLHSTFRYVQSDAQYTTTPTPPLLKLQSLIGYSGNIPGSLCWTGDGQWLAYPSACDLVWTRAEPPSTQKEQCVLYGHTDNVSSVAVNHLLGVMATGQSGPSPTVRIWDIAQAKCIAIIAVHVNGLLGMDISHDGRNLCTVGKDAHRRLQIVVWDISQVVLGSTNINNTVSLSAAAGNAGSTPRFWIKAKQTSEFDIKRIKFSPHDSNHLVTCGRENVRFWRIRNQHLPGSSALLHTHARDTEYYDFAFESVYSSSQMSAPPPPPPPPPPPSSLQSTTAFSNTRPNSSTSFGANACTTIGGPKHVFVGTSAGTLLRISILERTVQMVYKLHDGPIYCVAMNEGFCVTGSGDKYLRVWPLDFSEFFLEAKHESAVTNAAVSPDGLRVAIGAENGTIGILDVSSHNHRTLIRAHFGQVLAVATDPNSHQFATTATDGTIRVWDMTSCEQLYEFSVPGEVCCCLAFSPNQQANDGNGSPIGRTDEGRTGEGGIDGNQRLACGFETGSLRVFDVAETKVLYEFGQHRDRVAKVVFSPSGEYLFTAGVDGQTCVFDARRGYEPLRTVASDVASNNVGLAVSGDGTLIATTAEGGLCIVIMDIDTFTPVCKVNTSLSSSSPKGRKDWFTDLCFAPGSGDLVVLTHLRRMLRYRVTRDSSKQQATNADTTDGAKSPSIRLSLMGETSSVHRDTINALAVSPGVNNNNQSFVVTGGRDGLIKVWLTKSKHKNRNESTSSERMGGVRNRNESSSGYGMSQTGSSSGRGMNSGMMGSNTNVYQSYLGHSSHALGVAFSYDGQYLVSVGADGEVLVWQFLQKLTAYSRSPEPRRIEAIAELPTTTTTTTGSGNDDNGDDNISDRETEIENERTIEEQQQQTFTDGEDTPSPPSPSPPPYSPPRLPMQQEQNSSNNNNNNNNMFNDDEHLTKDDEHSTTGESLNLHDELMPNQASVQTHTSNSSTPTPQQVQTNSNTNQATSPNSASQSPPVAVTPNQGALHLRSMAGINTQTHTPLIWDPQSGLFVTSTGCALVFENLATRQQTCVSTAHQKPINALALSFDAKLLASATGGLVSSEHNLAVWSLAQGPIVSSAARPRVLLDVCTVHPAGVVAMAFSPAKSDMLVTIGSTAASRSDPGLNDMRCVAVLWNTLSGVRVAEYNIAIPGSSVVWPLGGESGPVVVAKGMLFRLSPTDLSLQQSISVNQLLDSSFPVSCNVTAIACGPQWTHRVHAGVACTMVIGTDTGAILVVGLSPTSGAGPWDVSVLAQWDAGTELNANRPRSFRDELNGQDKECTHSVMAPISCIEWREGTVAVGMSNGVVKAWDVLSSYPGNIKHSNNIINTLSARVVDDSPRHVGHYGITRVQGMRWEDGGLEGVVLTSDGTVWYSNLGSSQHLPLSSAHVQPLTSLQCMSSMVVAGRGRSNMKQTAHMNSMVVTCCPTDKSVRLWKIASAQQNYALEQVACFGTRSDKDMPVKGQSDSAEAQPQCVALACDQSDEIDVRVVAVVGYSNGSVRVFDSLSMLEIARHDVHSSEISACVFVGGEGDIESGQRGPILVCGTACGAILVSRINTQNGELLGDPTVVALSGDDTHGCSRIVGISVCGADPCVMAVSSENRAVSVWRDVRAAKNSEGPMHFNLISSFKTARMGGGDVMRMLPNLRFLPHDADVLVAISESSRAIVLWSVSTECPIRTFNLPFMCSSLHMFSTREHDMSTVLIGAKECGRIRVAKLSGHTGSINHVGHRVPAVEFELTVRQDLVGGTGQVMGAVQCQGDGGGEEVVVAAFVSGDLAVFGR